MKSLSKIVTEEENQAAEEASDVLKKMTKEEIDPVGAWFLEWYPKTGFKKLAKVLVAVYTKKIEEK